MLYMCFHIGEVRYALQARSITSVIPRVNLQPGTGFDNRQCGSLLYKQQLIPVFDLCQILLNRPAVSVLSTRILLLNNVSDDNMLLGIVVEQATGTVRLDRSLSNPPQNAGTGALTRTIHTDSHGTLQIIQLPQLMEILLGTADQNDTRQHEANNILQTGSVQ